MKTKIVSLIIFIGFFASFSVTNADITPIKAPQATTRSLIAYYSNMYSVSQETLYKTIKCESGFNPTAHKLTKKENSWGLSQINLKAHPNITKAQAINKKFAIEYMAKNIAHHTDHWSCYKT